jgi:hypothetical protein
LSIWADFVFGGQQNEHVLILLGAWLLPKNLKLILGRAAREAFTATWIFGTGSVFALGLRKTTGNHDRVGRLHTAF